MWLSQWGSEYSGGWLTDGLRHYWPLEGINNPEDAVGDWDIDFLSSYCLTEPNGKHGQCIDTDNSPLLGSTNADAAADSYAAGTISVWVNPSTDTGWPFDSDIFVGNNGSGTSVRLWFDANETIGDVSLKHWAVGGKLTSAAPLSSFAWHHLVATLDKDTLELWVDGVSEGTVSLTGSGAKFDLTDIGVAHSSSSSGSYDMDELAIWDRVLSDSEIQLLYNNGDGVFYPGFTPPFPVTTSLDSATLEFTPDDVEPGPVNTSLDSATLTLTPDDVEQGPVTTSLDSATLTLTPYSIGPHITAGIDSATLEFTPSDVEPGPVNTSLDSATLTLTPDDVEPGPVTTSLGSASLTLTPQDIVLPVNTSLDSASLTLTPDEIEIGPFSTALDSAALTLTPDAFIEPITASIGSATLELTPDDIEPGPVSTSLTLATTEIEVTALLTTDLAEPAVGNIVFEFDTWNLVPGEVVTTLSGADVEFDADSNLVSVVVFQDVPTMELALLTTRLFGTKYSGVVLSDFAQANAAED